MAQDGGRREGATGKGTGRGRDPRARVANAPGMLVATGCYARGFVLSAVEPVCQTRLYSKSKAQ